MTQKPGVWSISRGGPGPDIEVVAAVLVPVSLLVILEGTKSKLDQQKLPARRNKKFHMIFEMFIVSPCVVSDLGISFSRSIQGINSLHHIQS